MSINIILPYMSIALYGYCLIWLLCCVQFVMKCLWNGREACVHWNGMGAWAHGGMGTLWNGTEAWVHSGMVWRHTYTLEWYGGMHILWNGMEACIHSRMVAWEMSYDQIRSLNRQLQENV